MAPIPTNTTARLWVDYVTGNLSTSQEHTVMVRGVGPTTTSGDLQSYLLAFLTAIGSGTFRAGWRPLRARLAQTGQNFSLPVPLISGLAAFVGTQAGSVSASREAEEWTWQGRSTTTGRRVDLSIYGLGAAFPDNFRWPAGGSSPSWVAASINALNTNGSPTVGLVVDGSEPQWYSYVNVNYNSYWERRIRSV